MSAAFAHLHLHSEYSLVDSTLRIPELVRACATRGVPALAITDRNNLFALVKFQAEAEKAGIKPIAGADVLLADGDANATRMTLLCRDREGYLALSRLLTRMWMHGHRVDGVVAKPEWLREDTHGLFALAGRHSPPGQLFADGREADALAALRDWQRAFGENLHLELTRCGLPGETEWNAFALHAAGQIGLPVVASNDVRFLDREGFEAHDARVCIASGRVLDDTRRPRDYSAGQYLKSADEMAALFADVPDAVGNTLALAQRCNFELALGTYYLPAFPVPSNETLESWIRAQSREGLAKRLEKSPLAEGRTREDYDARLELELGVIVEMGFPGYFLIVADFINWAKDHGIPVGPGRGSGAGSLVAWALGITDLDPLPYDLLFERFLNPERVSMPDFDIDFCMDRRDEVIDYVARKYGRDRVSQIITYGTMAAKAVLRDAGRVLGFPYGFVDGLAKLIPLQPTDPMTLEDAIGVGERARKESNRVVAEFRQRYEAEEDVRDLVDLALQLEDLTRNAGKHAGGVVIAPSPLSDFCPLFAEHDGNGEGRNPVTQFDKDDVEKVGLVKFDFLGLRTLTIIDWAMKAINARRRDAGEAALDIAALELTDKPTYELFARGDTVAVFQFESRGMRELLKRAKPDTFEDIIALAALFRPGPLGSGMDRQWCDRKHGIEDVSFPHPALEPVLAPTYGVIVYQEQVMQIAQVLAGYSLGGADLLRRAMGKKKPEEMAKERAKFEAGAAERGVDPRRATQIFDLMEKFAEYGFNKSHSAAYALVAYQTAWLKVHYPAEFMAAVLSSDMDNTDKVVGFLDEARVLGLTVLPPDANASTYMFEAVDAKTIRYGLGAIKGVGRGACEAIVEERERGGGFPDLLAFCRRVDATRLNRRVLEALVSGGALDALAKNRATLMLQLPEALKAAEQIARNREAGIVDMFGNADTGATDISVELPECEEWPLSRRLQGERDALGHYLSGHPLDAHRKELLDLVGHDLGGLERLWERGAQAPKQDGRGWRQDVPAVVAGLVVATRRKGDGQVFVLLEDGRGKLECAFFNEAASEFASLLVRDRILLVEGGLREDEFNGGFSLRARRAWDYDQLCMQAAQRLSLQLDLRVEGTFARVEALLGQHRPGKTPLRFDLLRDGVAGTLDLNGSQGVRVAPDLVAALRQQPGVEKVHLQVAKPWAQ
ncbi:DNA polymerase III subunit alpha [Pseudoluteimonas lycopersici]|uniref:DNA polymerase III subunit alpha n=1 Tax=Pseudoluteimonas lycopersici TaxID=1324796 RepID=A0A516V427_9GAMM|nr:DNA polymerase III subunit alpha [Lysobacter lycopersici]QDQ73279.1 DNA polymerase III subunit alpha [Lysobacter lycopersici]